MVAKINWRSGLLKRAQKDPEWWIQSVLGNYLWNRQVDIANSIVHNERTAVAASFGVGKTYVAARLILWFLYNFRPAKVISTAPTGRQVKDLLWSEIKTAHRDAKMKLGGTPLSLSLRLHDDQFAVGFSTDDTNMDMFTGYHSPNQLVVFDQAGGIPPITWTAAEGLMTSENCRWLAIGNTAISDCAFADICMPERKSSFGDWNVLTVTAEESPNVVAGKNIYPGLISYDWVEKRLKQWGEDDPLYKIFVKAMFVPSTQMSVVPFAFLERAYEYMGMDDDDEIEIGLDVARSGLDSTVWFARCGERALEIKRHTGNDTMVVVGETIEYIRHLERKYKKPVRLTKVDVIGIGAGVYDRLAEQDIPVLPINNAETRVVVDRERFLNVRAEMAWALRHRFEDGRVGLLMLQEGNLDFFNNLQKDLQVQKYLITSSGRIQLFSKDKIKEELGRSPDYWDACVMAYEEPGGGPPSIEFFETNPVGELIMEDAEWASFVGLEVDIEDPSFRPI